ncbi:unnamed protein product [Knipowitschia caucasica]|uniref:Fibrinogen C-terminal domain-containing protein n=1 Tax=Knipowitschia caucasica TaxID=637954 RepID=A0AAV2K8H3_KNICA
MVWSLVWVLLLSGLVSGFDESPDLNQDEDLFHPSFTADTESREASNSGTDQTHVSESLEPNSLCGHFSAEATSGGGCRVVAMLPAGPGTLPRERCPDLFRCRSQVSDWSRESTGRKQELQHIREAVSEVKRESGENHRRVKGLESEGHVSLNSSLISRLTALESRHTEVSTLLHVHAALVHEIQLQLQVLSKTLRSTCSLKSRAPPVAIRGMALSTPPLGSCPSDCAALLHHGVRRSGIYSIVLAPGVSLPVYCDMETDGGGWTVLQRRADGSISFNRGWEAYSHGFGDLRSEFWMGNTPLHLLVTQRHCSLRVHLQDWDHETHWGLYQDFRIEDEQNLFRLHVSGFLGSISDSFGWYHDGQDFATPDSGDLCAEVCHSGWWFRQCYQANLNGVYYQGGLYSLRAQNLLGPDGLVWFSWTDSDFYSLKSSSMMIRPQDFRPYRSP